MNKKMRNIISIMLVLVVSIAIGACSPKTETPAPEDTKKEETQTETDEPAEEEVAELGDKTIEPPGGYTPADVTPNRKYKIALANWNSTNSAASTFANDFQKAADYYGVELLSMDNKQDPVQALSNFENAKTWGAEYYFQYNEDPAANLRIGQLLRDNDIPGIAIQVPLGDDFPYYRLDPVMSGEASGTPLAERGKEVFGDDVAFAVVMDCPEAGAVIQDRAAAAEDAIKAIYPDLEIITYSTEGDADKSRQKMADLLTANPEGNFLVWGHMDQWTLAALSAIKAAGRQDQCIITSIVALDSMLEELQQPDSPVYGTVAIRPETWAWELLPAAIEHLNGGASPEMDMYQPAILITADNLDTIYPEKVIK